MEKKMIEVINNLFVGDLVDCSQQWFGVLKIVHACRDPCFMDSRENDDKNLFLDLLDSKVLDNEKTLQSFTMAINFVEENFKESKVLVHCYKGWSRSAGIALVCCARNGAIRSNSFENAYNDFLNLYSIWSPGHGIFVFLEKNWDYLINYQKEEI